MSDLFQELVMIPLIIKNENFSLEVLLIEEEEIRCDNGKAIWKRKGASIKDRKIVEVNDRILFQNKSDYLKILPDHLPGVFTSRELAKFGKISVRTVRQMTYCLRKSGVIRLVEKKRNELTFEKVYNKSTYR